MRISHTLLVTKAGVEVELSTFEVILVLLDHIVDKLSSFDLLLNFS